VTGAVQKQRVRVMEMATIFAIGGTERQLVELANGIDKERFELRLSCIHRVGPLLAQLEDQTPPEEFRIDSLYGAQTWRQQVRLARHLAKMRTQVFHAQGFYPNVFGVPAARLARVPAVIASIRDLGDSRTRMQQLVQRFACAMADAIVVNAEVVKRQLLAEGWPGRKIHVIHNGVDLSRFSRAGRAPSLRAGLKLPASGPLVMVVSRLYPGKGIEQFMDAAAIVAARNVNARFVIVGDAAPGRPGAEYRATLDARARHVGLGQRLVFTGFRLDVPDILAHAQVAVIPSLSEATSNALLESMASGAPVIATDVGGNPDVVEDGINGVLVPPDHPDALARAILRLLEWPGEAARLGEEGRRFVNQHFSVEQMVRKTEQLYLSLLGRASRGQPLPIGGRREPAIHC
jgi:glycosyltransferase involved in cell wall biosynthesis